MADQGLGLKAARDNVAFLDPRKRAKDVFEELLRNYAHHRSTGELRVVNDQILTVRRFSRWMAHAYECPWPWQWERYMGEAWCSELRRGVESSDPEMRREPLALDTMRHYQGAVRRFIDYLRDPGYPWAAQIEHAFGRSVTQIFDEFNCIRHHPAESGAKSTGRFPFSRDFLQQIFDYLDDRVDKAKGKTTLFKARDSAMFKTFYAYGLRRQELALAELPDLSYNPYVPDYGRIGGLMIRYGKGSNGSGPKTRLVRTVPLFDWSVDVLEQYLVEIRPRLIAAKPTTALFPGEHGGQRAKRVWPEGFLTLGQINDRWNDVRLEFGIDKRYKVHCLRHSYMTHLLEAGYPAKFIQLQAGHGHLGSMTTYTNKIGDEFCNAVLRHAQQTAYTPRTPKQAARIVARIEADAEVDDD